MNQVGFIAHINLHTFEEKKVFRGNNILSCQYGYPNDNEGL
jgi:hypothetical protein